MQFHRTSMRSALHGRKSTAHNARHIYRPRCPSRILAWLCFPSVSSLLRYAGDGPLQAQYLALELLYLLLQVGILAAEATHFGLEFVDGGEGETAVVVVGLGMTVFRAIGSTSVAVSGTVRSTSVALADSIIIEDLADPRLVVHTNEFGLYESDSGESPASSATVLVFYG